jgi:hypothetical protein
VSVNVDGSYGVNFMTFCDQRSYEAHPEVVNVPGSVENYCNFHSANYSALLPR